MHCQAVTPERVLNWLRDGRGQGHFREYAPFIQVRRSDYPSHGQSHILYDPNLERQHHLLSDLERKVCVANMAQPIVCDLREQFPEFPFSHPSPLYDLYEHLRLRWDFMLPVTSEGSLAIAKSLRIRHANYVGQRIPYIYTVDQLLTVRLPGRKPVLVALAIKYWSDLRASRSAKDLDGSRARKRRHREFRKLRRSREYWRRLGIPWLLVTDRQINKCVYSNLEWALSGAIQRISPQDVPLLKRLVLAFGAAEWGGRLTDQLDVLGPLLRVNRETTVRLLKLAIWRALIPVDLTRPVNLLRPLPRRRGPTPAIEPWSVLKSLEDTL